MLFVYRFSIIGYRISFFVAKRFVFRFSSEAKRIAFTACKGIKLCFHLGLDYIFLRFFHIFLI